MKTVILTFDDGLLTHFNYVCPLLREYGFNATFFISGQLIDDPDRKGYVQWGHVKEMHDMGFEMGNHLRQHFIASEAKELKVRENIKWIEYKFESLKADKPVSLSYPGFHRNLKTMDIVRDMGYRYGRGGCDRNSDYMNYQEGGIGTPYDVVWDNQFNICTLGMFGNNFGYSEFVNSLDLIGESQVGVYCGHAFAGDDYIGGALQEFTEISRDDFKRCLDHLKDNDYKVIALRDVAEEFDFGIDSRNSNEYMKSFVDKHGKGYHKTFCQRMGRDEED